MHEVVRVAAGFIINRADNLPEEKLAPAISMFIEQGNVIARVVGNNHQEAMQVGEDLGKNGIDQHEQCSLLPEWQKQRGQQHEAETKVGQEILKPEFAAMCTERTPGLPGCKGVECAVPGFFGARPAQFHQCLGGVVGDFPDTGEDGDNQVAQPHGYFRPA